MYRKRFAHRQTGGRHGIRLLQAVLWSIRSRFESTSSKIVIITTYDQRLIACLHVCYRDCGCAMHHAVRPVLVQLRTRCVHRLEDEQHLDSLHITADMSSLHQGGIVLGSKQNSRPSFLLAARNNDILRHKRTLFPGGRPVSRNGRINQPARTPTVLRSRSKLKQLSYLEPKAIVARACVYCRRSVSTALGTPVS